MIVSLFLFVPLFLFSAFLAFYIPGRVVLGKQTKFSPLAITGVSIILGFVLWGWQGYLFGYLQLRWLSYLYLLIFLALFIKRKYWVIEIPKVQLKKLDLIILLIIVLGIFGQVMPFVKNGFTSSEGLFIHSYNYCDHIWHAALAQELASKFPPDEPALSRIALSNYNFWFHFVAGEFSRVFNLPLFFVQFTGLYPIASILLAIMGYTFAKSIYDSKFFIRLFLFFLYFSGDAIGWLFSIVNGKLMLNMSKGFDDAVKFMDTPGYGSSLIIALTAFYLFVKYKDNLTFKKQLLIGFLIGSLIGFKVYMGIGFMLGFGMLALFGFLRRRYSYIPIFLIASFFSATQFLPFNANSGGLFFLLFEVPRGFIAQEGLNLGWIDQRWRIFAESNNYLRIAEYAIYITGIYLVVQFGFKVLGFIPLRRTIKIIGLDFFVLLYSILFFSLFVSMFFYQKVGGGNIWQFLLPVSLMLCILASLNLSLIFSKLNKFIVGILITFIIIFTIPSWVNFTSFFFYTDYLSDFHGIPTSELNSYNFIKSNSSKNSLLLLIGDTSYSNCLAAPAAKPLTERELFFSGTGVTGVVFPEYIRREKDVTFIKDSKDEKGVFKVLKKNGINYILIFKNSPVEANSYLLNNKFLEEVYSNKSTIILKVD